MKTVNCVRWWQNYFQLMQQELKQFFQNISIFKSVFSYKYRDTSNLFLGHNGNTTLVNKQLIQILLNKLIK